MLKGKVALITGAGQGVGQGIALAMAARGASIAVTGRTLSKLEDTCALIAERGGKAIAICCNVKDARSLKDCVDNTVKQLGTIDILVNNAQEVPLGTLHDVSDDSFEAGWQSGPLATLRLMKLCYPYLKGDGCIINLASSAAKRWDASGYAAYGAVKEAIRALTKGAASEWGKDNIRTNVILPIATSAGLEQWIKNVPQEAKAFLDTIPMGRAGHCEQDIGNFVAVLCSKDSAYINGQSIALDGGQAYMS